MSDYQNFTLERLCPNLCDAWGNIESHAHRARGYLVTRPNKMLCLEEIDKNLLSLFTSHGTVLYSNLIDWRPIPSTANQGNQSPQQPGQQPNSHRVEELEFGSTEALTSLHISAKNTITSLIYSISQTVHYTRLWLQILFKSWYDNSLGQWHVMFCNTALPCFVIRLQGLCWMIWFTDPNRNIWVC